MQQQTRTLLRATATGFAPNTAGKKVAERKRILRDRLNSSITNLAEARANCKDRKLFLTVVFYLCGSTTEEGRKKKDLDNLLKLLLDVLSESMVAKGSPNRATGLGLISDDNQVYEIHCSKKLVGDPTKEGIDFEISEHSDSDR